MGSHAVPYAGHGHVHDPSLPDAFPLRKAEGVGLAKSKGLVTVQNPLSSSLYCTDVQFFA
jgi:hypothetical protein